MYYKKKLIYRLFAMPLFDDLDENQGVLGFLLRHKIRASKRAFMDSVVHYSIITVCFAALGIVYLFLATPNFKAPFSSSIYPKIMPFVWMMGPLARSLRRTWRALWTLCYRINPAAMRGDRSM